MVFLFLFIPKHQNLQNILKFRYGNLKEFHALFTYHERENYKTKYNHLESSPIAPSPQFCLAEINKNLYFFIILSINLIAIDIIEIVIETCLCLLFLLSFAFQLQNTFALCFSVYGPRGLL